jgi:DNA primase
MTQDNFAAVRERVDPVALVADLTKAKVKSRSPNDVRLAPCPFCGSKTGFSVNPQTKTYCCHHAGCGEQGDVFTFVKRVRGFTRNFDALTFLAQRSGYELPKAGTLGDDRLRAILGLAGDMKRAAADYYEERLWACRDEEFRYRKDGEEHTATVLGYQTDTRGHSEAVLKRTRVGWADGKLLAHLKERYREHPDRKLAFAALLATGLVKKGERGFHDLFCPRGYIYPVLEGDRVITFTAKYPDDSISNYQAPRAVEINGREVLLWGGPFYFLNHDALGAEDLVLVEGEDDLLSVMDLAGCDAVCGLRGTPNRDQLAALAERRRGKRTFLAFDADDAGRDLTWTLWETLAGPDYDVRVVAWGEREEPEDDAERTGDTSPVPEAETTAT